MTTEYNCLLLHDFPFLTYSNLYKRDYFCNVRRYKFIELQVPYWVSVTESITEISNIRCSEITSSPLLY